MATNVVRAPALEVSYPGWHHLEVVSSLNARWARIRYPRLQSVPERGARVEISLGATRLVEGEVSAVRLLRRVWQATVEPAGSRQLRGDLSAQVGPRAWRDARAADVASDLMAVDASALPEVKLKRWSVPRATVAWALQALLNTVSSLSGKLVVAVLEADGTPRLGPWEDLVRPTGIELRSPYTVLRRRGTVIETWAAPLAASDLISVDGQDMVCEHVRTEAEAGRYRSHLTLGAAP